MCAVTKLIVIFPKISIDLLCGSSEYAKIGILDGVEGGGGMVTHLTSPILYYFKRKFTNTVGRTKC